MLRPEEYKKYPQWIVDLYLDTENRAIKEMSDVINIGGRLLADGKHQVEVLYHMGYSLESIEDSIYKHLDKNIYDLEKQLEKAALRSYKNDKELYKQGGKLLPDYQLNTDGVIQAIIKQTKDDIKNITRTSGLPLGDKVYRPKEYFQKVLNQSAIDVASGMYDYDQAIIRAIKVLGDEGLKYVEYKSGFKQSLESTVRSTTLTGLSQITGHMSLANAEVMNQDLMEISAHMGARPSHAEWQGKIVSLSGREGYLSIDDIGYGSVEGFKGAYCRHDWYPYFESSSRNYTDISLQEIDPEPFIYKGQEYTIYEATQKQRYLERQIRKYKKRRLAFKDVNDEEYIIANIKVNQYIEEYKDFSDYAGLKQSHSRHIVYRRDRHG